MNMIILDWLFVLTTIVVAILHIWIVMLAFSVSFIWGVCCLAIGCVGALAFAVDEWKVVRIPWVILYSGTTILLILQ